MSLFPAYSEEINTSQNEAEPTTSKETPNEWLENNSFLKQDLEVVVQRQDIANKNIADKESDNSSCSEEDTSDSAPEDSDRKRRKTQDVARKKKDKKFKRKELTKPVEPVLDFSGQEEFYVDKKRAKQYNTVRTLHKPACPRYRTYYHTLGRHWHGKAKFKPKRYYKFREENGAVVNNGLQQIYPLTENEYTLKMGELNRCTIDHYQEIQHWLDLIELQVKFNISFRILKQFIIFSIFLSGQKSL